MAFAFAVFVLGLDYALPNRGRLLGLAIWLLIVIITAQHDLLPLWRTYMVIDKFGISGRETETTMRFIGSRLLPLLSSETQSISLISQ